MRGLAHLCVPGVSVLVDLRGGVPAIVHWGAELAHLAPGDVPAGDADGVLRALGRPVVHGGPDAIAPASLVPQYAEGWPGRPGLGGHRPGGRDFAPRFVACEATLERPVDPSRGAALLSATCVDPHARLALRIELALHAGGALVARVALRNEGDTRYLLASLGVTIPLPSHASELVTFDGRWSRETRPRRHALATGAWTSESRAGRTSHERPPTVWALAPGTGEWAGEAWGLHLAWSGNHALHVEVLPDGRRVAHLAELLLPGEVCVDPGATHEAPEVVGAYSGGGLTPASWAYHRLVRARPHHPGASRPRPVVCNTWEATYFDHDAARLRALADAAAAVGAERFVLDDGWFGGRRHDRAGLGDWVVSREAHPEGLAPLISHVRSLGMDFGIWVEPEMVNPDSDLHRAHPDWVLADPRYEPVLARHQLVLDLARPEAYAHVRDRLHALLAGHEIAFVKWDMNRDHVHATGARGAAGTRSQTLAVYRLLDELRAAHPRVEFESCASGGGRVDLEILRRTERVWASDCIDPLERQHVQRGTSMLLPPEVIGSHVGADRSHTTGRRHDLAFRVATAMFGHLGLELDLAVLDAGERSRLAEGVALYRRHRALVHGGDAVRFDPQGDADPSGDDPELLAHGVYSVDRSEALVCLARLRTGRSLTPPPLRLPGLDPARRYRVARVALPGERADRPTGSARHDPAWLAPGAAPLEMTGEALATLGVQPPALWPEQAFVVHLVAVRS
ncbi:MAG: hypothetical protein RL283_1511 [Actinomycetota bacterium]